MARKSANETKNANGEVLQEREEYTPAQPKLHKGEKWEEMSNKDREESVRLSDRNLVGQHAKAMKERGETPYYMQDTTKEQIEKTLPYSPVTGQPFFGWLEEKMRMHQQMNGFKEAKYVDIEQAHYNRQVLKPLTNDKGEALINDKSGKEQYPIGVKFAYYEEYEKVPRTDKDGNIIFKKDKDGNDLTWTDKNGNTQKIPETALVKLQEPKLVTKTYYNVEQLDNSNQKFKDKPLDLTKRHEFQAQNAQAGRELQANLSQFDLLPLTRKNLEKHMDASSNGKDFEAIKLEQQRSNGMKPTQSFVPKKQQNQTLDM